MGTQSHPTWVRGLKLEGTPGAAAFIRSHPTWVRGLKPQGSHDESRHEVSHPTWVRGLKPFLALACRETRRRTLRGCVD